MSNYTKATNFATKDALPTGNALKIVSGTEIDDEFNAIQVANNTKSNIDAPTFTGVPTAPTAAADTNTTQLATTAFVTIEAALKADLASPALTGVPTAPSAIAATDSTQIATTAFVQDAITAGSTTESYVNTAISNLVDSSPATLNTLNELAAALGDDAAFSTTVTNSIATKLPLAGGTLTGGLVSSSDITVGNAYISSGYSQFTGLRVPNNGYIGTPTTTNALQIQTNGNIALVGSIQASGNISTSSAGVTKWYQPSNSGNPEFYLGASDTERLGIQTVYDGGTQSLSTVSFFTQTASTASNKADMKFSCDGTLRLTLNDAGATVAGDILASGNITANSDVRLKSSIETIPNALEKVLSVRGVTFDMNDARGTGVIAQELERVLPEAVFDNEDGMKSVAYGNVVGLLIEAIKEQQTQIETLMDMVGE